MTNGSLRVLLVLGSRSEWGYIRPVYEELESRGHSPTIFACNMATSKSFGNLAKTIADEGFSVAWRVDTALDSGSYEASIKSMAIVMSDASSWLTNNHVDWVIVSGDRPEQLAFLLASSFAYIPSAHIQAGEKSGNIDGLTRHAMARFAHLHFAANEDARSRLVNSGESPWRVVLSGAPQLDGIDSRLLSRKELVSLGVVGMNPYCVAIFHANTDLRDFGVSEVEPLIRALERSELDVVWIAPNNDPGSGEILSEIMRGMSENQRLHNNLPRSHFATLLSQAEFLIGNSSSGILEAPSFRLPAVNIGRRQSGRFRGKNVIDVNADEDSIENAISLARSKEFRLALKEEGNPYGSGQAAKEIVDSLEKLIGHSEIVAKDMEL